MAGIKKRKDMKINDIKKYLTKSLDKAKMFANIAEPNIAQSGIAHRNLSGIFYALSIIFITVSTPVWSVNAPTALRVLGNGKGKPFLFSPDFKNIKMSIPNSRKECSNGITIPHKTRTPTKRVHTKKKLLEYLSVEENAKNKAYYYIISSGNLEQFTNFCKQLPDGIDYGAACTAALILQFFNPQKTTL